MNSVQYQFSTFEEFNNPKGVESFLKLQLKRHIHLDWRKPVDWLVQTPSIIMHRANRIEGILCMPAGPTDQHWIRFFATRRENNTTNIWTTLFQKMLETGSFTSEDVLIALCYQNWMESLLINSGWVQKQKVIVLNFQGALPKKISRENLSLRRMKAKDLEMIHQIDSACFRKFWRFSRTTIQLAFEGASYATVAEMDGKIVGFQISTADLYRAHLTRLAVDPQVQNQGIGSELVRNMIWHFSTPWIREITVNTQHDNLASIQVYEKAGFKYQGEFYPIMQYKID